jgi:hypothetical protein
VRDPNRIPIILEALGKYWEKHPDLRLCQLISNITRASLPLGIIYGDIFYIEDSSFMKQFEAMCENVKKLNEASDLAIGIKSITPKDNEGI